MVGDNECDVGGLRDFPDGSSKYTWIPNDKLIPSNRLRYDVPRPKDEVLMDLRKGPAWQTGWKSIKGTDNSKQRLIKDPEPEEITIDCKIDKQLHLIKLKEWVDKMPEEPKFKNHKSLNDYEEAISNYWHDRLYWMRSKPEE
jgi:hypothetical protein